MIMHEEAVGRRLDPGSGICGKRQEIDQMSRVGNVMRTEQKTKILTTVMAVLLALSGIPYTGWNVIISK